MSQISIASWLTNKFLEWQLSEGENKTVTDFANYLGLKRSYLSKLMGGKRETIGAETADIIGIKYPEIYEISGLKPKDPLFALLSVYWDQIPDEVKLQIENLATPFTTNNFQSQGDVSYEPKASKSSS